jgi:Tfp pilus assembly protein PilN
MRAVNLLPPDLRSGPKGSAPVVSSGVENSGAGAFVVLGVLAFAVLALAAYVLAGNTVKDRQAELAAATAKSAAVTQQVATLKPYADFETVANARVQTVTDLANSRFDWEQALRDLSRAVPADVTLTSLSGDISSGAGGGGSTLRTAVQAPAISLEGCAPGQTQVARLMARLRDIDGVTRVSLSSSAAEKVDKQDSAATEREQRNGQPCGVGSRPKFQLVMFFEKAAAAVGTTPTTSTGTVSETPTPTPTPAASATPAAGGTTSASTTTEQPQGGATP